MRIARRFIVHGILLLMAATLVGEGLWFVYEPAPPSDHFVEFYFNESREAQLAGDLPTAIAGYEGVLKLEPSFAAAHHELCLIALGRGEFERAVARCAEAVRHEPDDANLLNSHGSALMQAGRVEEAIGHLERAVSLDPSFVSAWYNLAGAYHLRGSPELAENALRQLERLDPNASIQLRRQLRPEVERTLRDRGETSDH